MPQSLQALINMVAELRERQIGFTSLHENLDTTPGGRLVFHVIAALAEFIRELSVLGKHKGLAAAPARVGGRPTVATPESSGQHAETGSDSVRRQAEGMTRRVQEHPPHVRPRLEGRQNGAQGEHPLLRGVQVLDAQFEVGLLAVGGVRPGRRPEAGLADEAEPRGSLPPQQDEVVAVVQHGQVQGIAVEAGQLGRVRTVEVEGKQTDLWVAHGTGP